MLRFLLFSCISYTSAVEEHEGVKIKFSNYEKHLKRGFVGF